MGPFERVVAELTPRIRELPMEAQAALFLGASRALAESWREWSAAAGLDPATVVYDRGVAAASAFASGGEPVSPDLKAEVEASMPSEPTPFAGFTAALNCWICLDVALGASTGNRDPADYTWYLLESMFHGVSERLFGYTDVGSIEQEECDSVSLADPALIAAIAAIDQGIAIVAPPSVGEPRVAELQRVMAAIRP